MAGQFWKRLTGERERAADSTDRTSPAHGKFLTWDELSDRLKSVYSPADWDAFIEKVRADARSESRRKTLPEDWIEPSVTLAEAEGDPFGEEAVEYMRRHGLEKISRGDYLIGHCGPWPRPWDGESEASLPIKLRDEYLWIPPELRRRPRRRRKRKKSSETGPPN